ncbi:MAG: 2-dehydropantoate 2-reductase [Hyphomicrobiaceae bacterium]|nr:2-dehydropantoate 2-reductase [Hyphomicrobiaceae bacterium]MCC0007614.1 2-dehydropantoate 2-reductase [Hyphomicrobiaceae bacterium]
MSKPRIVILGAGGVGGYFGARLAQNAAADVTFLVRDARKAILRRDGLSVRSPHGNIDGLPVDARTTAELSGAAPDYLLLTCKAYDLDAAMDAIGPVVGPDTAIVPLLNGLAHVDRLNARFPRRNIVPGTVSLQVRQRQDGTIEHLNDWQFFTVGVQDGSPSPRVARLVDALTVSKVTATATTEILQKLWEKLVMLATLAAITTLMRAPVGAIARAPGGAALSLRMLETNAAAAAWAGHPVPSAQIEQWRALVSDKTSTFSASMLADMEKGAPVEADHIVGDMLARVRTAGLDDTLHAAAFANLKAYELQRNPVS